MSLFAGVLVSACNPFPDVPKPTYSTWTGPVTDIDGNVYQSVKIGVDVWMAENLKTTTYNDGTPIPNVTDGPSWANLESGAYSWYDNDIANKDVYGALYNWHAVQTGKLCPKGWSVPSSFGSLVNDAGGELSAGGPLKEAGTERWQAPNAGATNSLGFSARPGGCRDLAGAFDQMGQYAYWWCSGDDLLSWPPTADAWYATYDTTMSRGFEAQWASGYSVRCAAD